MPAQHLAKGLQHHRAGELDAAERSYRAALAVTPKNPDALHLLGLVALQAGKADEAVEQIRAAIGINPCAAAFHGNLGIALSSLGRFEEAVASFKKAIALDPGYAEALNNLANPLRQLGKFDEAFATLRRAVALKPDYADAWSNLGSLHWERGNSAEAAKCLHEVVRLKPGDAAACDNLGTALHAAGALAESAAWYRRAIECNPALAAPHNNLGNVLKEQGKVADALGCYRRALELGPRFAEALVGLAATQCEIGQHDAGIANYRAAIALKPGLAAAHFNLGTVCMERGEFAEAERYFRAAIERDPRFAPAHGELVSVLRGRVKPADFHALQLLAAEPRLSAEFRAILHFALVQIYDARGDYGTAADHARIANAARLVQWQARGQKYDRAAHVDFVDRLIAQFTPDYFARVHGWGDPSQRPIFIVGMPRSGTTLLEQVLAGHSHVCAAGELTLSRDGFEAAFGHLRPVAPRSEVSRPFVERLAQKHLTELNNRSFTAFRVVSKLPENYLYLGYLATILPRATIIHCRRDPRDVALSCWLTNFRAVRWASDIDDVVSRYQEYERLMAHWRQVLPATMHEVSYEETVNDLEGTARRIVAWCGLDWEPGCLDFFKVSRPVQTASVVQVRQPIYASSIGRWRNYAQPLAELFARVGAGLEYRL